MSRPTAGFTATTRPGTAIRRTKSRTAANTRCCTGSPCWVRWRSSGANPTAPNSSRPGPSSHPSLSPTISPDPSAGGDLFQQAAKAANAVAAAESAEHRPERGLVGGHHRLAEFALPAGDRIHRREVAAGHHEYFDLRSVDPGEGVARVLRPELPDGVGISGTKAFEGDGLEPVLGREIAAGTLVDLIRIR